MKATLAKSCPQADLELLEAYRARRSEAAYNELVTRHGAMVYRTCGRILHDPHAAEDAAQAVFLALAREPGAVRGPLPGWLHEVARRTSLKLLRSRRRRGPRSPAPIPGTLPTRFPAAAAAAAAQAIADSGGLSPDSRWLWPTTFTSAAARFWPMRLPSAAMYRSGIGPSSAPAARCISFAEWGGTRSSAATA